MEWIVRNRVTGEYLVSRTLSVKNRQFARRFATLKQAKTYISSSCGAPSEWCAVETEGYTAETNDIIEET